MYEKLFSLKYVPFEKLAKTFIFGVIDALRKGDWKWDRCRLCVEEEPFYETKKTKKKLESQ